MVHKVTSMSGALLHVHSCGDRNDRKTDLMFTPEVQGPFGLALTLGFVPSALSLCDPGNDDHHKHLLIHLLR